MASTLTDKLRQLGWTEYESRAYLAVLRAPEATGYRAARLSGVPGAKIYEALTRLVERGAVRVRQDGTSSRYTAVPPGEVMAGIGAHHARLVGELAEELSALETGSGSTAGVVRVHGRSPVLGALRAMLTSAAEDARIAAPRHWQSTFSVDIRALTASGVRCDAMVVSGSRVILVVDHERAVYADLGRGDEETAAEALVFECRSGVELCEECLRLLGLTAALASEPRRSAVEGWLDWEEAKQRRLLQPVMQVGFGRPN